MFCLGFFNSKILFLGSGMMDDAVDFSRVGISVPKFMV